VTATATPRQTRADFFAWRKGNDDLVHLRSGLESPGRMFRGSLVV
jgi:hypothetical protein